MPVHKTAFSFLTACGILMFGPASLWAKAESLIKVDLEKLISRADLDYASPAGRSEEGMPIGNGRMGTLIWTTPTQIKFQINRVDVYAQNCETNSFPERDSDYGSGCAFVDIDFGDYGDEVFNGTSFRQHLSVYDGIVTIQGEDVSAHIAAVPEQDVIVVEVEDHRREPLPIKADLRMLRYAQQYYSGENYELERNHEVRVRTRSQTATSKLDIQDGDVLLTQEYREADFFCGSAVGIAACGRDTQTKYANDNTVRITVRPENGSFAFLVGAAASFETGTDLEAEVRAILNAAARHGAMELRHQTSEWWHDFWSKGFVYMHSGDGQADFVEANYTYYLYLMGASSRGDFPPRFGGLLWNTNGDLRRWGSQHWWANTSAYYSGLMPANRMELLEPVFSMYTGMYDSCARAAEQQWGSKGIWIPETVSFDGLEELPQDIAEEMQELYLMRKPWEERSQRFNAYAETKNGHNSRWNWKGNAAWEAGRLEFKDKGSGPFGHTTHILGAGAKIAALYWQRYEYTQDESWLRERAYPMIKGAAEFYRNFPNFRREADGKYHLHYVNNSESDWGTSDTAYETACMHTIFPLAIRASAALNVDATLRSAWQEIADNLVDMPDRSGRGTRPYGAFVYGGPGAIEPLEPDVDLKRRFLGFTQLGSFIDTAGIGGAQIFRNRLRLREGPGAIDAEHIAGLAAGIHETLLDSAPETPGGESYIRLFNQWPRSWDVAFRLLARNGFIVSASLKNGQIELVEIQSGLGGVCTVYNPWPGETVGLFRNGHKMGGSSDALLKIPTSKGDFIEIMPADRLPEPLSVGGKI